MFSVFIDVLGSASVGALIVCFVNSVVAVWFCNAFCPKPFTWHRIYIVDDFFRDAVSGAPEAGVVVVAVSSPLISGTSFLRPRKGCHHYGCRDGEQNCADGCHQRCFAEGLVADRNRHIVEDGCDQSLMFDDLLYHPVRVLAGLTVCSRRGIGGQLLAGCSTKFGVI